MRSINREIWLQILKKRIASIDEKFCIYCVQVIFLASKSSSPIELLKLHCWSVDVFKMSWKFYRNASVSIMSRTQYLKSCNESLGVWHSHSRWRPGGWKKPTSFWLVWRSIKSVWLCGSTCFLLNLNFFLLKLSAICTF
jgi:hypothetical protein